MTRNTAVTVTPASGSLTVSGARIVFEPTAYDGSETNRVNLVLEANEEDIKVIRAWEQSQSGTKTLCNALTPNGLRVKVNKDTARCWGGARNECRCPRT